MNSDVKFGRVLGIALISTSITASLNEQSNLCWAMKARAVSRRYRELARRVSDDSN